jgi:hypothetical protein
MELGRLGFKLKEKGLFSRLFLCVFPRIPSRIPSGYALYLPTEPKTKS